MSHNYYTSKLDKVLEIYDIKNMIVERCSHSPERFYLPELGCFITILVPPPDSSVRTLCFVERHERHEGEQRCPFFEALLFGDVLDSAGD